MMTGDYKMALTSLRSSKWRSLLTMLGIIIGVASVVTIVSLGEGLKRQIVSQVNQLGSDVVAIRTGKVVTRDQKGKITSVNPLALLSTSSLTEQDVQLIGETPGIRHVAPMSVITNTARYDATELSNLFVVATTDDADDILGKEISYGGFFTGEELEQDYAVVGAAVAERLFGTINPVGQSLTVGVSNFLVRGVMEPAAGGVLATSGVDLNYTVFITSGSGRRLTEGRAQIAQILVKAAPDASLNEVIDNLRARLLQSHKGQENFTILKQEELVAVSSTVVNLATGFISSIAAISLLVGGIGIMNIMLVNVSERTREIGIRKAIGATNRQILNQFLIEGTVLSVLGGIIGILLSLLMNFALRIYTNFKPVITPEVIILAAGVSVTVGIVFALAPAIKASRKHPIDALRGE